MARDEAMAAAKSAAVAAAARSRVDFSRSAQSFFFSVLLGLFALGLAVAFFGVHQHLLAALALSGSVWAVFAAWQQTPPGDLGRHRRLARAHVRTGARLLKKHQAKVGAARAKVDAALADADKAIAGTDLGAIRGAVSALDAALDTHLGAWRKSQRREYFESVFAAILVALLLRAFVVEAFKIPSGSMIPTLLIGDHLFVNKFSYGFQIPFTETKLLARVPKRGDIIVFKNPRNTDVDFIKRVIGLPGDTLTVSDDTVTIDGVEQPKTLVTRDYVYQEHSELTNRDYDQEAREYEETLTRPGEPPVVHRTLQRKDGFPRLEGPFHVQPGHVFVMGDNRDNSSDSRVEGGIGQIPIEYIKGNALVIWLSLGGSKCLGPICIRTERMFHGLE